MAFPSGSIGPNINNFNASPNSLRARSLAEQPLPGDGLSSARPSGQDLGLIPNRAIDLGATPTEPSQAQEQPPKIPSQKYVIFGKGHSQIPAAVADLVKVPDPVPPVITSKRWTVTPQIEAGHQHQVDTGQFLGDNPELRTFIGPLVAQRYADRQHLTVVELGPATSTIVAQSLQDQADRYLSVEMSEPYAKEQLRRLDQFSVDSYAVKGDTYNLPLQDGSTDVIVTSCHPPFFSASLEDKKTALDQVYNSLKDGGEFVLFPFIDKMQPQEFKDYIQEHFTVVDNPSPQGQPDRQALILKKKPAHKSV